MAALGAQGRSVGWPERRPAIRAWALVSAAPFLEPGPVYTCCTPLIATA